MPTHGSLTKAGKVRSQTPKVSGRERVSHGPRTTRRNAYENRSHDSKRSGQDWAVRPGRFYGRRRR
ncbi:MAG: 30S ribosomal protein S30e [Candidatus Bathyarchaeia archaeon]